MLVLVGLAVAALAILYAGARLARYGDELAVSTGLGRSWIGIFLIALVTSFPEVVTGASAVLLAAAPDVAVGDVVGSALFNLGLLAAVALLGRARIAEGSGPRAQRIAATYGAAMIAVAGAGVLLGAIGPAVGWLGLASVLLVVLYVASMRHSLTVARAGPTAPPSAARDRAAMRFAASAALVLLAGAALPFLAERIAIDYALSLTFVGTALIATVTSLPEVVVATAALRQGTPALAAGGLLGSNLFDFLILAIDDLLYAEGPILAAISPAHLAGLAGAFVMTLLAIAGLVAGPDRPRPYVAAWTLVLVAYPITLAATAAFS